MEQKSLKKNSFYSFINAFSTLILPLITFPYASRILQPEGIGQVNFSVSIEGYFTMLAGLGIATYATREAAKLRDNKFELSKFCKEMLILNLTSMFISYILLFLSITFIPKLHSYKTLILVRSINIFFTTIGLEWLYTAEEDFKYISLRSLIFKLLSLIFLFTFVKKETDTVAYNFYGILAFTASNILNFLHSRKYINYKQKNKIEIKKHIKYIFTFFGMFLVTSLYSILDTSMLGFLSNDTQVGYYSAATRINKLVVGVLTATVAVLLPRLTYYKEHNETSKFEELVEKSISILLLLAIPMIFGIIFLSPKLIYIFCGEMFSEAIPAMYIISPIILAIGLGSITGSQILPSIGKEKYALFSYIIGATLNISLNAIFIPKMGAKGAAIGTVAAEFSVTIIQLIFLREFLTKAILKTLFQSILCCIPMIIELKITSVIIQNPILNVIVSIIFSIPIYFVCLALQKNKYYLELKKSVLNKLNDRKNKNA